MFLSLFFSWIKTVLCIAAAVLIQKPGCLSVLTFIGVAEICLNGGIGLSLRCCDLNNDIFLALAARGRNLVGRGRALPDVELRQAAARLETGFSEKICQPAPAQIWWHLFSRLCPCEWPACLRIP